jgi:hypothetical protein
VADKARTQFRSGKARQGTVGKVLDSDQTMCVSYRCLSSVRRAPVASTGGGCAGGPRVENNEKRKEYGPKTAARERERKIDNGRLRHKGGLAAG